MEVQKAACSLRKHRSTSLRALLVRSIHPSTPHPHPTSHPLTNNPPPAASPPTPPAGEAETSSKLVVSGSRHENMLPPLRGGLWWGFFLKLTRGLWLVACGISNVPSCTTCLIPATYYVLRTTYNSLTHLLRPISHPLTNNPPSGGFAATSPGGGRQKEVRGLWLVACGSYS